MSNVFSSRWCRASRRRPASSSALFEVAVFFPSASGSFRRGWDLLNLSFSFPLPDESTDGYHVMLKWPQAAWSPKLQPGNDRVYIPPWPLPLFCLSNCCSIGFILLLRVCKFNLFWNVNSVDAIAIACFYARSALLCLKPVKALCSANLCSCH